MALILVVDDDEALRSALVNTLEEERHAVVSAADGASAVSMIQQHQPDLVLCDILMAGLDGYAVLAAMRQDPLTAIIPLIFLTGVEGPAALRKGMELGADDYLTKPVRREDLMRAVEARLARHADARREIRRRLEELRANTARALPHEFLTPLTAVLGLSSLLMEDETDVFDPQTVRDVAAGIFRGGQRLQDIIGKFTLHVELDATLATTQQASTPTAARHSTAAVVAEAAGRRAAVQGREADLELAMAEVVIEIGKDHLQALVEELVENALLYSEAGTPVVVRCEAETGDRCAISVVDRGRGMPREQVDGLTTYVPSRRHDREPGMGLGLAIVRRIVQRWGGEIAIESAPGSGTTVRVRLRCAASSRGGSDV